MPPLNTIPTTVSPVSGCGSTPAFTTDEAIVPLSRSVDTTTSPWSPAISRRKSSISATPLIQPQRRFNLSGGLAARFLLLSARWIYRGDFDAENGDKVPTIFGGAPASCCYRLRGDAARIASCCYQKRT